MPPPIDARVIQKTIEGDKIQFYIALASIPRGTVTPEWSGLFLADGQPIVGSDFTLIEVRISGARGQIHATELPSESVRLFPPYYPRR